jgi:hypothetical protein
MGNIWKLSVQTGWSTMSNPLDIPGWSHPPWTERYTLSRTKPAGLNKHGIQEILVILSFSRIIRPVPGIYATFGCGIIARWRPQELHTAATASGEPLGWPGRHCNCILQPHGNCPEVFGRRILPLRELPRHPGWTVKRLSSTDGLFQYPS